MNKILTWSERLLGFNEDRILIFSGVLSTIILYIGIYFCIKIIEFGIYVLSHLIK